MSRTTKALIDRGVPSELARLLASQGRRIKDDLQFLTRRQLEELGLPRNAIDLIVEGNAVRIGNKLLGLKAKEQILLSHLTHGLGLNGFVTAIPQPDTNGEDLWLARQNRTAVILRSQIKGAWNYDRQENGNRRRYTQNVSLPVFLSAIHDPSFLFIFGLAQHELDASLDEDGYRPLVGFSVVYLPSGIFLGGAFPLARKQEYGAINFRIFQSPQANVMHFSTDGELFNVAVTEYVDSPENAINKRASHHQAMPNVAITDLATPEEIATDQDGKRKKIYDRALACACCGTKVLFGEEDRDSINSYLRSPHFDRLSVAEFRNDSS